MNFTLTYIPQATAELATLWLIAKDQKAASQAADAVERELRDDPHLKGELVTGSLRKIIKAPLVFYYVVSPDDCLATVWAVRRSKD